MNAPVEPRARREMERAFEETKRRSGPSDADRERITGALRARLGASVVPEGFVPAAALEGGAANGAAVSDGAGAGVPRGSAARAGVGRGGWLGVVVGTGVVAGAIGFVLGHGIGQHEGTEARESGGGPVASTAPLPASVERPFTLKRPRAADEPEVTSGTNEGRIAREGSAAREERLPPSDAHARTPALGTMRPLPRSARVESTTVDGTAPPHLSFADVLERLQRANLALRQGRAPLALIELAELDRTGGDILHEEREVTRVLALCAIDDVAGARRVAAPLLAGGARSIYAPRLDASCASEARVPATRTPATRRP
ncbi:MAG TPA: hypothetical protein VMG12_33315 [Polyangiaceae bacterium]|nr:hypothetical protein [Polyangiaceae bacterium]